MGAALGGLLEVCVFPAHVPFDPGRAENPAFSAGLTFDLKEHYFPTPLLGQFPPFCTSDQLSA